MGAHSIHASLVGLSDLLALAAKVDALLNIFDTRFARYACVTCLGRNMAGEELLSLKSLIGLLPQER